MSRSITQRPRARIDLLEQFVYFGEHANLELADRYLAAVQTTCLHLAKHPMTGSLYDTTLTSLKGIRRAAVKGFENHLIFYRPTTNRIDILRVPHGARDIGEILMQEEA